MPISLSSAAGVVPSLRVGAAAQAPTSDSAACAALSAQLQGVSNLTKGAASCSPAQPADPGSLLFRDIRSELTVLRRERLEEVALERFVRDVAPGFKSDQVLRLKEVTDDNGSVIERRLKPLASSSLFKRICGRDGDLRQQQAVDLADRLGLVAVPATAGALAEAAKARIEAEMVMPIRPSTELQRQLIALEQAIPESKELAAATLELKMKLDAGGQSAWEAMNALTQLENQYKQHIGVLAADRGAKHSGIVQAQEEVKRWIDEVGDPVAGELIKRTPR